MNPRTASPRRRILLAEDSGVIAMVTRHALTEAGYDVEVAVDGEECLAKVFAALPDLVLLDIMMPRMHGIEVLKRLRADARTSGLPVVMCSAKDFKTDRDEAMSQGATGYIVKSSDPVVVVREVAALLREGEPSGAMFEAPATEEAQPWAPVLRTDRPHVTLWGTRGSTPTPGARFVRHGGNTSCMSLSIGDDLLIFDAGSGIRDLGLLLMGGKQRRLHLFITHTHWDHIQGFPFFVPAYVPGFEITIYGSKGFGKDLEAVLRGQLDRDYFPVQLSDMHSQMEFRYLPDTPVEVGGAKVTWEFTHHPLPTVGYKIEIGGRSIVWMPDDEFLQGYTGAPDGVVRGSTMVARFEQIIAFVSGVDVLIHEAQYLPDEYPKKIGWGHSSVTNACLLMKFARPRRWVVTHHDPLHDDVFLDRKLHLTRQILGDMDVDVHAMHGYDGQTVYL